MPRNKENSLNIKLKVFSLYQKTILKNILNYINIKNFI